MHSISSSPNAPVYVELQVFTSTNKQEYVKKADVHYQRRCPSVREQTPGLARELGVVRLPMGKKLAMTLFPHKIYSLCSRFTLHSRKKDKLVLHLLFLLRYANNFYFNHD
jgi:hypothetical protein